ncbi:toll/interleukin-1 receptor domain-containing adapter protein [Hyperolius riggenbachi]|uniref:toll/interleukin-1 receptor domain-containing adapter protein n=1 Tax=Hyperolius riggenbachi TaxID=752182 RepID=UPI0035A35B37
MDMKKLLNGRSALRRRVFKMGGASSSNRHPPHRQPQLPPKKPIVREMQPAPAWPENSTRWQKSYDVYICSSGQDASYAMALRSYLQKPPENLRCFLPMLDMNVGGAIPTEMVDGAENSHCWVMLLTPNFLSDQWCQYQMHQFLALAPCSDGRLIPVMVGLTFTQYPKELKHMVACKDINNDQKVFKSVKRAIESYLRNLPVVAADQVPCNETNSNTSETPSSSSQAIKSSSSLSVTSSLTEALSSNTPVNSTLLQESTDDTSLRSCLAQESTDHSLLRRSDNQGSIIDTSLSDHATQESTCSLSARSMLEPIRITSVTSWDLHECISETQRTVSLNPSANHVLKNNEALASNITIVKSNSKRMDPSASPIKSSFDRRSCKEKETINMDSLNIQSDPHRKSDRMKIKESQTPKGHIINTNLCKVEMTRDFQSLKGDVHTSCIGKETESTFCHRDIYTNGTKTEIKGYECLQSNIYTSCGEDQLENESLQVDLYTCGEMPAKKDSLNFLSEVSTSDDSIQAGIKNLQSTNSNIYTSCSGTHTENKDFQSPKRTTNTNCGGGKHTQNVIESVHSNVYTKAGMVQAENVAPQRLQRDICSTYGETAIEKSQSIQSDMCTSCLEKRTQMDSHSVYNNIYTSTGRTPTDSKSDILPNYEEKHSDTYMSRDISQSIDQTTLYHKLGLYSDAQEEDKNLNIISSDLYKSCTGCQTTSNYFQVSQGNSFLSKSEISKSETQKLKSTVCTHGAGETADKP